MTDNPFAEPDDSDRTIIRPMPGGKRPSVSAPPFVVERTVADATVIAPPRPKPARPLPLPASDMPVAAGGLATGGGPLLAAAAPLLQLLARLRNTLTPPDPGDLRERAAQSIAAFEQAAKAAGTMPELLRPAHYALCASLDDVVLNTPWGSAGSWASRSLVSTFHNEVRSGERFFDLLTQMRQEPAKYLPVMELMYLCLSLGFMGRYRLSPRGPAEIDRLREEVYSAIAAVRAPIEAELSPAWRGVVAPYKPGRAIIPVWVAASGALAVVGAFFVWFSVSLNAASDQVFEEALRAPPTILPSIARASVAQAPVAAVDHPMLDRLRAFLKPEIDAGLVEVLGRDDTPIIRVRQHGMFGSGSAAVASASVPLLERIGAALQPEPGKVQVIGYTDDRPISTVRFPSNYQLSAARASAAAAIVAKMLDDAARIRAEGRADADPIASNTTAEGRDANRRIEIVLHRQG